MLFHNRKCNAEQIYQIQIYLSLHWIRFLGDPDWLSETTIQYNKSAICGLLEPVLSRALRFCRACAIRSKKALGTRLSSGPPDIFTFSYCQESMLLRMIVCGDWVKKEWTLFVFRILTWAYVKCFGTIIILQVYLGNLCSYTLGKKSSNGGFLSLNTMAP